MLYGDKRVDKGHCYGVVEGNPTMGTEDTTVGDDVMRAEDTAMGRARTSIRLY